MAADDSALVSHHAAVVTPGARPSWAQKLPRSHSGPGLLAVSHTVPHAQAQRCGAVRAGGPSPARRRVAVLR